MNKRDTELLDVLLPKLVAHFADPKRMSIAISRGEGRAVVAAIRERNSLMAAGTDKPTQEGLPL